jgi:hypothetical protein
MWQPGSNPLLNGLGLISRTSVSCEWREDVAKSDVALSFDPPLPCIEPTSLYSHEWATQFAHPAPHKPIVNAPSLDGGSLIRLEATDDLDSLILFKRVLVPVADSHLDSIRLTVRLSGSLESVLVDITGPDGAHHYQLVNAPTVSVALPFKFKKGTGSACGKHAYWPWSDGAELKVRLTPVVFKPRFSFFPSLCSKPNFRAIPPPVETARALSPPAVVLRKLHLPIPSPSAEATPSVLLPAPVLSKWDTVTVRYLEQAGSSWMVAFGFTGYNPRGCPVNFV